MRIGIDARALTETHPSGITIYTYYTVEAMVRQAPQDHFILFISGYHQKLVEQSGLQKLCQYPNVTCKHLRWPNKFFHGLALLGLAPKIDQFLGDVDVVFVPNVHMLPITKQCPVVLTVHDLSFVVFPECLSWKRRLWHYAVNVPKLLQRVQRIITVSDTTRHDLTHIYQVADSKISTIYPGVPAQQVVTPTQSSIKLPKKYALILATLEPRKNILATIQAFQIYRTKQPESSLELVVVGGAGWKSQRVIQQLHSKPYYHYYGYVSEDQKQQILKQAYFLIYPSLYEGFGFPPLEALQHDVPTIASNAGAIPEIMQASAYYVHPYSVAELAEAIHLLDTDTRLRQQLLSVKQNVLQRYDWTKAAQATLTVLRQAVY